MTFRETTNEPPVKIDMSRDLRPYMFVEMQRTDVRCTRSEPLAALPI